MNQDLITIGKRAQIAANKLALMNTATKNKALLQLADDLIKNKNQIIAANQQDLAAATQMPTKFTDRLMVNSQRIADMANGLRTIADLNDPTSQIDKGWITKDGLQILQQRVPLGVIGIIFEARPNVTVDATGLTFKSGNAVILRGGKEAIQTNTALVKILRESLQSQHLPVDAVQLITDTSHAIADEMMNLTDYIDVLIPRGGRALIQRVVTTATVPVIETGAGNCHIYIDKDADLTMATNITVNAKVQRPSVCNAAEKLLIHRDIAAEFLPVIAKALMEHGVQLRGDEMACQLVSTIRPVTEEDWDTEYNDLIMAVKIVDSLDDAISHINHYSTHHSESIITNNITRGRYFQQAINSACVYVNASTRFTDGGEFGFGAEIGISTQKLHARGPMGLQQLTTIKYEITGNGQIRK
ncbi:glutamate-5-semialdehyde dehydrogenase [Limosilactobacillus reuteri]|jgi:glutamate-5-semialdehyde dehydrogenase|uniref:Gamma-glutamyl phosphate reductase n=1 Tax=Limosilactobacillus reuteri subsp. suis (strain ATCC 53608 / LMG 31752 / 1063) TaxID=927703 RepID=F8KG28_LIMR5|nr:glutamate-5-semialdehyde dehydrogenase [Limosilactobacillus reuteri]CCC04427.1 gamma-glutamyl phosphate reductase [Limosilactobacillus reuteri subsp. suis]MCC4387336.1 glutamate-5-semialdehyde dehydrogenase [Limosilactobacillus reuteri]MCC4390213.1 glutamate-5-semialdehyde dehydrogenase [Limosilactobacillus reuteri]MCC4391532.1 glutamate-5-semialdehyde dehydrogenase [Limosilactobacillus reuteri]MCC4393159.1 glutamate-5-semialdehyde dehydrogenase [Limosilactobacillus reuteri]